MTPRSNRRRSRGQVLVLAALTFLLLALTMMASFSISHAVHERIRLQAAADSAAFTMATMEARAFNTMGYMNRAIAGAIVAEMSVHAWRAIAMRDAEMYKAGRDAFLGVVVTELMQCNSIPTLPHCFHALQAFRISQKYNREYNSTKNTVTSKDSKFNDANKAYSKMIKGIVKDEKEIMKKVNDSLSMSGSVMNGIKDDTAPQAQALTALDNLNSSFLGCAVEGTDIDSKCQPPSYSSSGQVADKQKRMEIMESAATAAANPFAHGRGDARNLSESGFHTIPAIPGEGIGFYFASNPDNMMKVQGNEGTYMDLGIPGGQKNSVRGNKITSTAQDTLVMVTWKHGFGIGTTKYTQNSDNNYEGVCKDDQNCFVNFRMGDKSSSSSVADNGQPSTYGGFKQNLRLKDNGQHGAWEIDDKAEVKSPVGEGKFKYASDKEAYAVAKGKTYFHQFGDWTIPPNFFDPFWRAKLHHFQKDELKDILSKAGDSDGEQIVSSGGPVEGAKPQ